jgi:DUF1680 family protein
MTVDGKPVQVRLTSMYPWDGAIQLTLTPEAPQDFALNLRIPGWCGEWMVKVNGAAVTTTPAGSGYVAVTRTWRAADVVELNLAMPVQTVYANPNVRQLQGRLALQRGPIVYCMESVDNGVAPLDRLSLSSAQAADLNVDYRPELLGGVAVLRGVADAIDEAGWSDQLLYRRNQPSSQQQVAVTAIPYATWDNRAPGEMRVWFRTA